MSLQRHVPLPLNSKSPSSSVANHSQLSFSPPAGIDLYIHLHMCAHVCVVQIITFVCMFVCAYKFKLGSYLMKAFLSS